MQSYYFKWIGILSCLFAGLFTLIARGIFHLDIDAIILGYGIGICMIVLFVRWLTIRKFKPKS